MRCEESQCRRAAVRTPSPRAGTHAPKTTRGTGTHLGCGQQIVFKQHAHCTRRTEVIGFGESLLERLGDVVQGHFFVLQVWRRGESATGPCRSLAHNRTLKTESSVSNSHGCSTDGVFDLVGMVPYRLGSGAVGISTKHSSSHTSTAEHTM